MPKAIVLAGGRGTKCWPFSVMRNKCAIPVGNVPLISRLVDELRMAGFGEVAVVTGHSAGSIRAALKDIEPPVKLVHDPYVKGTATATLLVWKGEESVLLVYGDVFVTSSDIETLWEAFVQGASAAVLVRPLAGERPQDWLCAHTEGERLASISGHPRSASHRLCGLFALSPEAYRYVESNPGVMEHVPVGGMPLQEAELAESIAMMLDDGVEVAAVECQGPFVDLDKPWHILEANETWLRAFFSKVEWDRVSWGAKVHDSAEIRGKLVIEEGAEIGPRVVLEGDAYIAKGAALSNGAILGPRTAIGEGAVVKDYALVYGGSVVGPEGRVLHCAEFWGVLMRGAFLSHYCEVAGVVGERVDIGAATVVGTLRFDDDVAIHRVKGRREYPRVGANVAYFGDFSRTGVNAILMPGVKIGIYSCVGPGVVLYHDLPDRKAVFVKQNLEERDWGPERYGW